LQQLQFSLERRGVMWADVSHALLALEAVPQSKYCLPASHLAMDKTLRN
jgi:hypothetical protein